MPYSSADRWFRAAGTIFWSRLHSERFRFTDLRWKISAKWPRKFLAADAANSGEQLGRAGRRLDRGLLRIPQRAARMGAAARKLVDQKSRRDESCPGAHRARHRLVARREREALARMAIEYLWPVSVLYSLVARVRVWCYARGIFKSAQVARNSHQRRKSHGRRARARLPWCCGSPSASPRKGRKRNSDSRLSRDSTQMRAMRARMELPQSDEVALLRERLSGKVQIGVGADRYKNGEALLRGTASTGLCLTMASST